ncbi:Calcium-binding EF hand family protein [Zostera marina]|uniref:Calcium-binding EF hand family protein n=1 Tax=Zostera marina TaxID=29655 RepID=A0A0K9NS82_ZOSMR|nr:Calcium-binding EF hand family protein [Zostera marina]
MGIPMSMMGSLGLPKVQSLSTDRIFDQFFSKDIKSFEEFHITFLDVCNKFNSAMPGEQYRTPKVEIIKEYYYKWKEEKDAKIQKKMLVGFLTDNIYTAPTDNVVVMTGLVAPPAAMVLRKAGDSVLPLKKFKLHLIPDFVFIPSITCLALIGAKLVRLGSTSVE